MKCATDSRSTTRALTIILARLFGSCSHTISLPNDETASSTCPRAR
uniref:Uncharacterized protein n=1 Tax=Arundo donax TaxID=35708 RepID=A0A0A9A6J7_ARUDO